MKHPLGATLLAGAALLLCAGCQTRSISDSDYKRGGRTSATSSYRGELSELDVVGISVKATVSEDDIRTALQERERVRLESSSRVLLVQSGADLPDAPMLEAMRAHCTVASFSGRPGIAASTEPGAYSHTLRLVAAKGGYDKIVCYWGELESAHEDKATRTISWVPLAGYLIPDQREHMRIKLKAAIVDVATGRWTFVAPPAVQSSRLSSILSRAETDQALVQKLKADGYGMLARELLNETRS